jgi:hypothetical protein
MQKDFYQDGKKHTFLVNPPVFFMKRSLKESFPLRHYIWKLLKVTEQGSGKTLITIVRHLEAQGASELELGTGLPSSWPMGAGQVSLRALG